MARKKIQDMIEELRSWLPNYDHGPDSYPTLVWRLLASLPGGEAAEDMGYEPLGGVAWHEADQLGRMLEAIQDKRDVEELIAGLMADDENGNVVESPRRARRGDAKHTPGMPTVTAIPHNYGNGYAYTYVYNGEEYSSQRKAPFATARDAIKAGQLAVARAIEWDNTAPMAHATSERHYPPSTTVRSPRPLPRRR